jgi:hypothetical protein
MSDRLEQHVSDLLAVNADITDCQALWGYASVLEKLHQLKYCTADEVDDLWQEHWPQYSEYLIDTFDFSEDEVNSVALDLDDIWTFASKCCETGIANGVYQCLLDVVSPLMDKVPDDGDIQRLCHEFSSGVTAAPD